MRTANDVVRFSGADTTTLTQTRTSDPFRLEHMDLAALCATVSAAAALSGTLKLQACCDPGQDTGQGMAGITGLSNWVDVADSSTTVTADGSTLWNLSNIGFKWIRVVFTWSAGSGTLAVRANAKGRS